MNKQSQENKKKTKKQKNHKKKSSKIYYDIKFIEKSFLDAFLNSHLDPDIRALEPQSVGIFSPILLLFSTPTKTIRELHK